MSVVVEREGNEDLLLEDVTRLELGADGLTVSTLFEGPRTIDDLKLKAIDFMAGKVYLQPRG